MRGDSHPRPWLPWLVGALAAFSAAWWTGGTMRPAPPPHAAEMRRAPALTEGRTTTELAQCLDEVHLADDALTRSERFVALVEGC